MARVLRQIAPVRLAFHTLGCRLNQYDTEGMKAALRNGGEVEIVPWLSKADVYVLNSCTVTGKADQECRRLARQVKRREPGSKVVVAGCYAQTQSESLQRIPEIDGIVGNPDKDDIATWLPELLNGVDKLVRVSAFTEGAAIQAPLIDDFGGRSRAYVKVQDGCNLRCAYCLIWQARGPARSIAPEAVLAQLHKLAVSGFKEVVLAGVHLGSHGRDLRPRSGLVDLLRRVLPAVPYLRLRLSSIHPNEVTDQLLALFEEFPNLRPHLHISLQSGSDTVLARMRRPYRRRATRAAARAAAQTVPAFGLGADLIVGFPGETEAEFAETLALVEELPFTYLHVFRYSARPGTAAAALPGAVHPEMVSERSQRLRQLARRKGEQFARVLVGQWREAIVESARGLAGWRQSTTDNYATVLVPETWSAGCLVRLRPERFQAGNLWAGQVEAVIGRGGKRAEVS